MSISGRRTPIMFYSHSADQYSHRVRMVLQEKRIVVREIQIDQIDVEDDLPENPNGDEVPTLVDRDLVLFHSKVIMEYLDERYPHPPLLPIYPVARAEARLMMQRIQQNWAARVDVIVGKGHRQQQRERARKQLRESVISYAHMLNDQKYFVENEFTIVDCCAAPVLWRLDHLGIKLPERQTKSLRRYMNLVFSRPTFQSSLSEIEEEWHKLP